MTGGSASTSSLAVFQRALGRLVLAPDGAAEAGSPDEWMGRIARSAGLRFTRSVQQSWCRTRVARTAALTLAVLPPAHRDVLLSTWLQRGGGTRSFSADEGIAFLDFAAGTLEPGSHAASLCRFERAVHVAAAQAGQAARPAEAEQVLPADPRLAPAEGATLVGFRAPPALVLEAARSGTPLPPVQPRSWHLLVAPGVPGLVHVPEPEEVAVLESGDFPLRLSALLAHGHDPGRLLGLVRIGALAVLPLSRVRRRKLR